ncbi:MAG: hypothetical protein WCK67_05335 [bacterium]
MAANIVTDYVKYFIENVQAYFRISLSYWRKNKPIQAMYYSTIDYFKNLFSANKKLQVAKYRVNHLKYRLYQMEKLIDDNNPSQINKGKSFNQLR